MNKASFSLAPMVVACVVAASGASGQLPFTETFETSPPTMAGVLGPVDGQHGWSGGSGAVVQDSEAYEFYQAARIGNDSLTRGFDDAQSNVWFVLAWKPRADDDPSAASIPSNATVVFWADASGTLSAYSNETVMVTAAAVDTSTWSRVLVHSDYVAKEWDLWLDGTKVIEGFGFYADTLDGLTGITFMASADAYFDDVRIGTTAWNPSPGDTDGDGMADEWERAYWLSPNIVSNSAGDYDGDGSTEAEEDIAGTNPNDITSVFAITNITSDSQVVLQWPGVAGRLYGVGRSSNVVDGFTGIASNLAAVSSYTDTVYGAESESFYRIDVRKE